MAYILGFIFIPAAENREASQKRRFLCPARKKAQKHSKSFSKYIVGCLSSIFDEARRKKIPFEAVYPYAGAPKGGLLYLRRRQPLFSAYDNIFMFIVNLCLTIVNAAVIMTSQVIDKR